MNVLAIMEASSVTGPAKNLIEFSCRARSAVRTSIVTFQRGEIESNLFAAAARESGIEADVITERFRFDARVIADLGRIVERQNADIIQSHNVKSHFVIRLSGLWRKRPWIAFHHGYTATDWKMHAYNQLDRWSLRAADKVITVSHSFARDMARAGVAPARISVLHNAVDASRYSQINDEYAHALKLGLGISASDRVVLAVGRLSHEKGHLDLVSALGCLQNNTNISAKLVIVGSGPEMRRIRQRAVSLGIGGRVIFAGQVSDVRPFYRMADVMVLPSHSEGSPNVLLEAMAAGLPVIATSVGGVTEIVAPDESALLVDRRDPRAMARAIERLLTNRQLRMMLAQNARKTVLDRHSPESRFRALLEVYRQFAPQPTPAF